MPDDWTDYESTAPTIEPVTVLDARRQLDLDDSYRDADIELWIVEARKAVEHDARTALINQTRVTDFHDFPSGDHITLLGVSPVSSVTSITYEDTAGNNQTLATSVYKVDANRRPCRIYLQENQSWPSVQSEPNVVHVTYVAGYGAAPENVPAAAKSAILMYVRHRFLQPDLVVAGNQATVEYAYEQQISILRDGSYP